MSNTPPESVPYYQGSIGEAGAAVVQARALAALVNAILDSLPPTAAAQAVAVARMALADDPKALEVLAAGLRVKREADHDH